MQYDFIWRHGGADTTLVTFTHHFDPRPDGTYGATEYDADAAGIAAAAAAGDQLVWRWSITAGSARLASDPQRRRHHLRGPFPVDYLSAPDVPVASGQRSVIHGD